MKLRTVAEEDDNLGPGRNPSLGVATRSSTTEKKIPTAAAAELFQQDKLLV